MVTIRPELRAAAIRWREALVGAVLIAAGLWIALGARGNVIVIMGLALAGLGLFLAVTGTQRALLRRGGGGAGMVEIRERQLTYFSGEGGSAISLDDVRRIAIETRATSGEKPDMFWLIDALGQPTLRIPADAVGAEAIFDALAGFPGADYAAVLRASGSQRPANFDIWHAPARRLH